MAVGIGRVADREVEMGRPGENTLPVRERLEAPLAGVAPHAAVTDASEGKIGNDHVHDDVVDAGVARARPVDDLDAALPRCSRTGDASGEGGRSVTNWIAASMFGTVSTGRMGPKISSFMTGASGETRRRIVGAMYRSWASALPPQTTSPSWSNFESLSKLRSLTIRQ